MIGKSWRVCAMTALVALAALSSTRADSAKVADEGKAADFKGKTFDLKENERVAFKLDFEADKKFALTVKGEKQTDIHLFVFATGRTPVAKDVSPGPDCLVTYTPKESGKLTFVVFNKGPGVNRAAVKITFPKD